jgi:hypothetical protein
MEGEQRYGFIPERQSNAEPVESSAVSDPIEAEREARAVQLAAEQIANMGFAPSPEAVHYEVASRDLEHLKATDSELADDIISASLAELELSREIGSTRFEVFKQVQTEGLNRTAEEFRHKYRALLEVKDEIPAQRYDRLRTKVAQIARDLFARLLREIAVDERTKEACARDAVVQKSPQDYRGSAHAEIESCS